MLICPQQLLHQNRNSSSHNNAKRKSLSHCRICLCPFVTQRFGCSCGKQNGSARWWYHFSSATNIVSKISPLVYRSKSNVAILVLGNNITLRQLHAPHVHLCHVSNKRLILVKSTTHGVLILCDHGGASRGDFVALCHTWTTTYYHTILPLESIVSVGGAPCEADMVPCIKVKTNVSQQKRGENGKPHWQGFGKYLFLVC